MKKPKGGGCGLLVVFCIGLAWTAWWEIYPFLARDAPVAAEVLVIEGWVGDDQLREAVAWAESNGVKKIYATGGPIETGSWLAAWKTHAEMAQARLEALDSAAKFEIAAAPAAKVRRDRTRESARALQATLGMEQGAFNVASGGPHTRRSWRAFRREFGKGVEIGSVALAPAEYGAEDWWRCSEGVRSVISESVALAYDLLPGGGE